MHVGIDEPGGHIAAFQVNRFGGVVVAETDDVSVFDGDAAVGDTPGKDVDDSGVGQQQVGRGVIARAAVMIFSKFISFSFFKRWPKLKMD